MAGLLAGTDEKRSEIMGVVRDFYDTRSKLIHGGELKSKHHGYLQRVEELRAMARRLLRSFVGFAVAPVAAYGKKFFQEKLDTTLVNSIEREKLRKALALDID